MIDKRLNLDFMKILVLNLNVSQIIKSAKIALLLVPWFSNTSLCEKRKNSRF